MSPIALDTMPGAREVLRAVDGAGNAPVVLLLSGRSGTGKSLLLDVIRQRLRAQGLSTIASVPKPSDNGAVVVADDLQNLSAPQLDALRTAIESGERSFVGAMQPRPQNPALRALTETVTRRGRSVELRALGSTDIGSFARELGVTVPRTVISHIHTATAGVHGGVVAALLAAGTARLDAGMSAVDEALAHWMRSQLAGADAALLDTLVVAATGTGLDAAELAEVLNVDSATATDLLARARACALVTDADLLLGAAVPQLRVMLGDRRYVAVQRRLLETRLDAGLLRDQTGALLAESGVRDPRLAEFLINSAQHNRAEAARYYAAAAAAGAEVRPIAMQWADAASRAGDDETAQRLAEPLLDRDDTAPSELAGAVRVCASVLTRRGLVNRAAALYRWLGPNRVGADWAVAATILALAGDGVEASDAADNADRWPPTQSAAESRLIANALLQSLDPHGAATPAAISALVQAAHTGQGDDVPCSAVTVAALLSMSAGEPRRAADAVRAAAGSGPQLPVLSAWNALRIGDECAATDLMHSIDMTQLAPRDKLLAHALAVGLARRGGDAQALHNAWTAAFPLFDEIDVDLLSLLPVGELWLAGIGLRDEARIQPLVSAALALIRKLGRAPAWTNAFHWYGVQAAIAKQSPQNLLPHAHALKSAAADGDPQAAVLADAGRTWLLVLRGQVDMHAVASAVSSLAAQGHTFDAARLAGDAAHAQNAAGDATAANQLLKLARSVRIPARPEQAKPTEDSSGAAIIEPRALSDREREVAELVLLGLTYREIGARLYISAKTVEHHVARIRRRIGAGSRSELLSMLRAMGHGSLLV
ncbi:LuxR C-terminal-related transcriptional regulator [Nocardia camponoti]|uniref:LuxR family transcriptional regulator n=1 Tax=Nocardia camponoti TaxID=1616106 RepID=A0A917QIL9_9NOCA|nr:LuxR C-terminal-related transcriptional regulator [Nocardia camponoti]GGK52572.1 LuxR family transcriptional regulator [Nocardia camponoti]